MGEKLQAQDPSYSQLNLNLNYYNPAYTGHHGGYQFNFGYRSLWPNVPGQKFPGPLSTYHAWFDGFVGMYNYNAGVGAYAMQNTEGQGQLRTTTYGVAYAQHLPKIGGYKTDQFPRLKLSVGFRAYLNTISINWDKLVFTDQLNLDYGISGSASAFGREGAFSKMTGDLDAGILLSNNFMGRGKWYNEVGFTMAHILAPAVSLSGSTEDQVRLPRKYVIHYRSNVDIYQGRVYTGPVALFEKQGNFYEINIGADIFLRSKQNSGPVPFSISVMNRFSLIQDKINTNAFIVGFTHKGTMGSKMPVVYYLGAAVDLPYMGLGLQTAGAYEVTLGIILPPKKINTFSTCPYNTFDHSRQMNEYYKPKVKNR